MRFLNMKPMIFSALILMLTHGTQTAAQSSAPNDARILELEGRVSDLERRLDQALGIIESMSSTEVAPKAEREKESAPVATISERPEEAREKLPDWLPAMANSVTPYLSARVRVVNSNDDTVLQNSASRGGFRINRVLGRGITGIGQLEWQINLTDDNTVFAPDDNTNSDITSVAGADAFATRLGYIGLDFGDKGRVTFGKQWGAYANVANFTDQFPVFGGAASGIYATGTDGGAFGTGRAERALQYQLKKDNFTLVAQTQLQGDVAQESNTYGLAFRFKPTNWLEVGAAVNQADLDADIIGDIIRVDDDPRSAIVAARVNMERWYLALGLSDHTQTEIGRIGGDALLVDSQGVEAVMRYSLQDNLRLFAGYNQRDVDQNEILDSNVDIEDYLFGADYFFTPKSRFYLLGRFREELGSDQFAIGYNLDF